MNLMRSKKIAVVLTILGLAFAICLTRTGVARAKAANPAEQDGTAKHFVAEYYYKAKWGHADEFIALFRKNHYPVLRKEIELGSILEVRAVQPRFHSTEDGRWDYLTVVFKNAAIANDDFDASGIIKQLYPDQETYKKEEQRRFEILEAHWDIPIKELDLTA
jgi:hypothetical protein